MTTFTVVIAGLVGLILGLYIASQISEHVDNRSRHKKFMDNLENFDKKNNKI